MALLALTYVAIDNYTQRVKLERLVKESTAINIKTLELQQASFQTARKTRDRQMLQERREHNKRTFKMGVHVALLRQQLVDNGIKPVDVERAIREFEQNVKSDSSAKNVSGQVHWLNDSNPLKLYFPDPHDYDKHVRRDQ